MGWAGQTVKLKLGEDGTTIPNDGEGGHGGRFAERR